MTTLDDEIAAFERDRDMLERNHFAKWVVYHSEQRTGIYDSFETAAEEAMRQYGREIFLIRQVGERPIILPASVLYNLL